MSHAVAERYAEAIHQLAAEKGCLDEVARGLDTVRGTLAADAALAAEFLRSRASEDAKTRLVTDRIAVGTHQYVRNLLNLLVSRRRESITLECVLAFFELMEAEGGVLRVTLQTARPMDESSRERLTGRLSAATGREVIADLQVDESLIGGVRLIVDSRLMDGSVRRNIERIGERMIAVV